MSNIELYRLARFTRTERARSGAGDFLHALGLVLTFAVVAAAVLL